MGLRFEQDSHWDDGICALGQWDLVKIWDGKWEYAPPPPPSGPSYEMRSSVLARIPGFRQRIIPEPHVPSRGSQARRTRLLRSCAFSYPEPILRAVNGARQGALAKSISNWHLIGHNEGCCSNTGYMLLPCFYGIRLWIWPEPLVAPRVRRALGTRMVHRLLYTLMTQMFLYTLKPMTLIAGWKCLFSARFSMLISDQPWYTFSK
jgi:hypothetical protein